MLNPTQSINKENSFSFLSHRTRKVIFIFCKKKDTGYKNVVFLISEFWDDRIKCLCLYQMVDGGCGFNVALNN